MCHCLHCLLRNFFFFENAKIWVGRTTLNRKSKETYGQTRGLGNLEMTHIGELAITGVLLNAVKTSRVCTMQGRT